jgi:hypothetical protein
MAMWVMLWGGWKPLVGLWGAFKYEMGAYGGQNRKSVISAIFDHLSSQVSGYGRLCEIMAMKDNMGHVMERLHTV